MKMLLSQVCIFYNLVDLEITTQVCISYTVIFLQISQLSNTAYWREEIVSSFSHGTARIWGCGHCPTLQERIMPLMTILEEKRIKILSFQAQILLIITFERS